MMLASTIHMCLLGKQGLRHVAELCYHRAHYAAGEIAKLNGYEVVSSGPFFKEFVVQTPRPVAQINQALAERGIVGGVLFFGFLGTCLAGGLWKRFKALSAEGKGQVGAMIAAVIYWLVHSSADWFWQIPAISLPVMVYLAMLVAPWSNREFAPSRWPLRLVGAGVAALAVAAVAPLYIADRYLTQSYATANPWMALMAVEQAQRFNPVDPYLPRRKAELALQIGDWPRAEEAYRRSIQLNPEHYASYSLLAFFYEEEGEPEKALSLYRKALVLNPLDKELNRRVARLEAETPDASMKHHPDDP
jgi:hypothetical protein